MSKLVYNHILLATELAPDSLYTAMRGKALAKAFNARLSILHAIGWQDAVSSVHFSAQMEQQMVQEAKKNLGEFSLKVGISECDQYVVAGVPEEAMLILVDKIKCDLIIVGHHEEKSWLSLFKGSTTNNLLARSDVDVLTVPCKVAQKQSDNRKEFVHFGKQPEPAELF